MKLIRTVTVEGKPCTVTISDEKEALLGAMASGGAVVGILGENGEFLPEDPELAGKIRFLCTGPEDIPDDYLELAAGRQLGLPRVAAETKRLILREFTGDDPLEEPNPWDGDGVFSDAEKRRAYIENQYGLAGGGLWAAVLKENGKIAGKCGITGGELGYHIYPEYRGRGLALEACRAVIDLARREGETEAVFLRTEEGNFPSIALAGKLGFEEVSRKDGVILMGLFFRGQRPAGEKA